MSSRVAAELLGVSRAELYRRRRARQTLGVTTASRRLVFPLAQFQTSDGATTVVPGLDAVLAVLIDVADELAAARWLTTPNRRLEGRSPWEALTSDPEGVRAAAAA